MIKHRPHKFRQYVGERGYYALYLVAVVSDEGGVCSPVKIGIANDPVHRFGTIQCGNFLTLALHHHWWMAGRPLAARVEKSFKTANQGTNIRGEWFDIEPGEAVRLAEDAISDICNWVKTEAEVIEEMGEFLRLLYKDVIPFKKKKICQKTVGKVLRK